MGTAFSPSLRGRKLEDGYNAPVHGRGLEEELQSCFVGGSYKIMDGGHEIEVPWHGVFLHGESWEVGCNKCTCDDGKDMCTYMACDNATLDDQMGHMQTRRCVSNCWVLKLPICPNTPGVLPQRRCRVPPQGPTPTPGWGRAACCMELDAS